MERIEPEDLMVRRFKEITIGQGCSGLRSEGRS